MSYDSKFIVNWKIRQCFPYKSALLGVIREFKTTCTTKNTTNQAGVATVPAFMAAEEKPAFGAWLKSLRTVRRSDYKLFLVVFCYSALFLGLPVTTLQFNQSNIHREFGVRKTDVRLPVIVDSLGTFILAPFIVLLGRVQRRPQFIGLALLCTSLAYFLVFLAHQFTDPSTYLTENLSTIGVLTCDANTTDQMETSPGADIEVHLIQCILYMAIQKYHHLNNCYNPFKTKIMRGLDTGTRYRIYRPLNVYM